MFGLPAGTSACLFDMDGVVTQTALVHAAAWKQTFDNYLRERAQQTGDKFVPFDSSHDYDDYVDGKPRLEGTRSFLQSRGINLPEGSPDDKPGTPTIYGLSNEKNDLVVEKIRTDGVKVYDGTIRYIKAVRAAGLRTAIVSSSANTVDVLNAAGIADLFRLGGGRDVPAGEVPGHLGTARGGQAPPHLIGAEHGPSPGCAEAGGDGGLPRAR